MKNFAHSVLGALVGTVLFLALAGAGLAETIVLDQPPRLAFIGTYFTDGHFTPGDPGLLSIDATVTDYRKIYDFDTKTWIYDTGPVIDFPGTVKININIDSNGALAETGDDADDLLIQDANGVILLTGQAVAFGIPGEAGPADALFDVRFVVTGGSLAGSTYLKREIGVHFLLEQSASLPHYTGDFTTEFYGNPKSGGIGPIAPNYATLGDFVWLDEDGNGIQDEGESGISNIPVTLYLADCSNQATPVVGPSTVNTDSNGEYLFIVLPHVSYCIGFAAPEGLVFTGQNQGNDDTLDSDADPDTGLTGPIPALEPGDYDPTWDAGLVTPPQPARLGDLVWLDTDRDGIQGDPALEPGVEGVKVRLYINPDPDNDPDCTNIDVEGVPYRSDETDAEGYYLFDPLPPGDYCLYFVKPAGYGFTDANQTDDCLDSDTNPLTGKTANINLGDGEEDLCWDAGLVLGLIGDRVWLDSNGNGIQDDGEEGVPGATVTLYSDCSNGTPGTPVETTTTDESGLYALMGF